MQRQRLHSFPRDFQMVQSAKREAVLVRKKFKQLQTAAKIEFPKSRQTLRAPNKRGVYIIFAPSGRVLHVGAAPRGQNGIASRLRNHLQAQSSFMWNYKPLRREGSRLRNGYKFSYLVVRNPRVRAFLESYAVGRLCPRHIGVLREARKRKNPKA